jgi:hypothetical protein
MRKRDDIMKQLSGPDVFPIHAAKAILEVLLDIREQNFRIESTLQTIADRPQPR